MRFDGNTDNGQLNIFNWEQVQSWAQSHPNRKIEVDVNLYSERRSIEQNRLWWAAMTICGNYFGYTKEEMNEICKFKLCKTTKVDQNTGEEFEYLESTSNM